MNEELLRIIEGMKAENKELTDLGKEVKYSADRFDEVEKLYLANNPTEEVKGDLTQVVAPVKVEDTASNGEGDSTVIPSNKLEVEESEHTGVEDDELYTGGFLEEVGVAGEKSSVLGFNQWQSNEGGEKSMVDKLKKLHSNEYEIKQAVPGDDVVKLKRKSDGKSIKVRLQTSWTDNADHSSGYREYLDFVGGQDVNKTLNAYHDKTIGKYKEVDGEGAPESDEAFFIRTEPTVKGGYTPYTEIGGVRYHSGVLPSVDGKRSTNPYRNAEGGEATQEEKVMYEQMKFLHDLKKRSDEIRSKSLSMGSKDDKSNIVLQAEQGGGKSDRTLTTNVGEETDFTAADYGSFVKDESYEDFQEVALGIYTNERVKGNDELQAAIDAFLPGAQTETTEFFQPQYDALKIEQDSIIEKATPGAKKQTTKHFQPQYDALEKEQKAIIEEKSPEVRGQFQKEINAGLWDHKSQEELNTELNRRLNGHLSGMQVKYDKVNEEANTYLNNLLNSSLGGMQAKYDEVNEEASAYLNKIYKEEQEDPESDFGKAAEKISNNADNAIKAIQQEFFNTWKPEPNLISAAKFEEISQVLDNGGFANMSISDKRLALTKQWNALSEQLDDDMSDTELANAEKEFWSINYSKLDKDKEGRFSQFMMKGVAQDQLGIINDAIDLEIEKIRPNYKESPLRTAKEEVKYLRRLAIESLGKKDPSFKNYNQVERYLDKIINSPEKMDNSGMVNFWRGLTSKQGHEYLPFVSGIISTGDSYTIKKITDKDPKDRTEEEKTLISIMAMKNETGAKVEEMSNAYNAGGMTADMLPFMGEMVATSGLAGVVGKATTTASRAFLFPKALQISGQTAINVAEGTSKTFGYLMGNLARTVASPQRFMDQTYQNMTSEMGLMLSDEGTGLVAMVDENSGQSWDTAFARGFGSTWTEYISEGLGEKLPGVSKYMRKKIFGDPEWMKRIAIGRYMRKMGMDKSEAVSSFLTKKIGYNGVIGEMAEEIINTPMQNLINGQEFGAGMDLDFYKELAISMSATGFVFAGGNMGYNAMKGNKQSSYFVDHKRYDTREAQKKEVERLRDAGLLTANTDIEINNDFAAYDEISDITDSFGFEGLVKSESGTSKAIQDKITATELEVADQIKRNTTPEQSAKTMKELEALELQLEQQQQQRDLVAFDQDVDEDVRVEEVKKLQQRIDNNKARIKTIVDPYVKRIEAKKKLKVYKENVKEVVKRANKLYGDELSVVEASSTSEAAEELEIEFATEIAELENQLEFRMKGTQGVVQSEANRKGNEQIISKIEELKKERDDLIKGFEGTHGFITPDKGKGQRIIINKNFALSKGAINVAGHEFFHKVLQTTMRQNPETAIALGSALESVLQNLDPNQFRDSKLRARLKGYQVGEQTLRKWAELESIEDKDSQEYKVAEKALQGSRVQDSLVAGEETLTLLSDALASGDLQYNETLFTRIGDAISKVLVAMGVRADFKNGRDVFNFVRDYNKSIATGKAFDKQQLRIIKKGAKIGGKLKEGVADFKKQVDDFAPGGRGIYFSKEASDRVQSIYEEKGEAGAYEIIEEFKPIVSRITEKRREAPNFDRELLMSEIEIGERGILDLISKYDPDSGVPLAAYINKYLPSRAIEASRRVLGEEFMDDVDERVDIAAEEVEVEVTTKREKKKTILSDRLGVKNKVDGAIKQMLPGLDIENLSFKTLKDQTPEITGEMFGISPKKLVSGANITKGELQSAQMFISKNSDVLLAMLPEGATTGGTATGVPNTLLKPFYTKTGRAKMEKTGTKAGLAVQVKNDNISKKDFLEVFGIIDGVPVRTDRNTSSRVLALANQTGKMMTNQAVRQELIDQGQPIQALGHIADGKAKVMFSKEEQAIGAIDRSLSLEGRVLFWDDISAFSNENVLDRSVESIKIGLENVYGDVPEISGKIEELAVALHKVMRKLKDPIVNNPIKLTVKLLETNNRQLSKVKEFFNSDITAADAFRDPLRVLNFIATTSVLSNKLFNPKNPGKSIAKILMMKGHLASSSKNTHLDRKQPLPGNTEFLAATLGSIPGIKFKTKTSTDGKTALDKNSITYNGKPIKLEVVTSAQSSQSALNDAKDSTKLDARGKAEDAAQELLDEATSFYAELYNSGQIDNVDLVMVSAALLSNMDAVLARAAKVQYTSDNAYDFTNPGKQLKYEHMQPRVAVLLNIWDAKINGKGILDIKDFLKNYTIQIIPNTMDDVITESKLGESLYLGQTLEMPSWIRTFNSKTKENSGGRLRPLVDVHTGKALLPSVAFVKATDILAPKVVQKKTQSDAVMFSRAINPAKGITVLDFDDTLATSKSLIRFTKLDGTTGTLNAEQYASTYQELTELGYKWDFSEFNKVVDGKIAPLFQKAMKLQGKFGPENMFVLTARPAEAAPAIFAFLQANGLNIPLKNITGLANSTAESKANWIAEKVGDGYNDFYFADDALQNVTAVKNMLNQFDVKSKVQQARVKFSKEMNENFNNIIEQTTGIESKKVFSDAQAKIRGHKSKYKSIIPPSAQDFVGLLYNFLGKGKKGEQDMAFFKKALIDPFARGIDEINSSRQAAADDYANLQKAFPDVKKIINKKIKGLEFTNDQAARVYLWNKAGFEVPGLSKRDLKALVEHVEASPNLQAYADSIGLISKKESGYSKPGDYWLAENITSDLLSDGAIGDVRADFLAEWQQNADQVFSKENLNKIEAIYGSKFREALEDILYRMRTGKNRPAGGGRLVNTYMNWVNNSVGAIMFLNMRSATLQTISATNYINWTDNNPLKAAAAFGNQKQFWTDFSMIWNSPYLKQRRSGNQRGINEAELSAAVAGAENKAKAALNYLLKKGFTPTQLADSFAISIGGAPFYRNRVKKYVKGGMSQEQAESQAFLDFRETTEVSQQSARPDMISQQQASPLGRLILSFQNTPMQYARVMNKATRDLVNGRGDYKTHVSKIVYYGVVQSIIFGALQSAIYASLGEDDEEEFDGKKERILNQMVDSWLTGIGYGGKAIGTVKNTIMEYLEQREKGFNSDHTYTILTLLSFSPPIGSKLRKIYSSIQTEEFNRGVFEKRGLSLDNPAWSGIGNVIEGATNAPLGRISNIMLQLDNAMDSSHEWWQRVAMVLGQNTWDLGIKDPDIEAIKTEVKEEKKVATKKRAKVKKEEKKKEKAKENVAIIKENKKKSKKDGVCSAVGKSGSRCGNVIVEGKSFCTVHEKATQNSTGKKSQCKKIKKGGKRCGMQTSAKSGFCYYHD